MGRSGQTWAVLSKLWSQEASRLVPRMGLRVHFCPFPRFSSNRNIVPAGHFLAAWHGRHLLILEAHLVRNYVRERGRFVTTKGVFSGEGQWQKFPLVPPPCLFTAKFLWGSEPVLEQTGRSRNP